MGDRPQGGQASGGNFANDGKEPPRPQEGGQQSGRNSPTIGKRPRGRTQGWPAQPRRRTLV